MYQLNGERAELYALPHMVYFDCELLMSAGGEEETTRAMGVQCRGNMTALRQTVPTRRGVEPTGRPAPT